MEHDHNHHPQDVKSDLFEKILRSRLSSTSSDSGVGCGSPPCSDNKMMEEHIHKMSSPTSDDTPMKFADPVQAIPMPWK